MFAIMSNDTKKESEKGKERKEIGLHHKKRFLSFVRFVARLLRPLFTGGSDAAFPESGPSG
jgi:hypothetical protein